MKLWTLQNKIIHEYLRGDLIYTPSHPKNIPAVMTKWFNNKTKFNHWPVWCWLNPPNIDEIKEKIKELGLEGQTVMFELKIPNNEKMIFINENKWNNIKLESLKSRETLSENDINQIFNITDIKDNDENDISVCIKCLNKNWIENSYQLEI